MKKKIYNISLLNNNEKKIFNINNDFFKLFIYNKEEFFNPKIKLFFEKKNKNNNFIFNFHFIGKIILICDISNNKFKFKINKKKKLNIIFSNKKNEDNNNYLILPFNYKIINISQYIYENILLMIPLKKIDPKIKKIIY
ncbi:MAG: YceD family protein [Candidatus Shikimatogenerans bostrichidophilus]|nr:MAG: YceD family protein [Candidatus Shikimatogenerans bostrichidophilus]